MASAANGCTHWFVPTATFRQVHGQSGGAADADDALAARAFQNVGAWILGRNMFGPVRGDWPDDDWKGCWGANPPFHTDVFVLTHHAREPVAMEGGTTFRFVTEGIYAALDRARTSAAGRDVVLGGGVTPSANTSRPDSSTPCTSRLARSCSARASTCSAASTCRRSASS